MECFINFTTLDITYCFKKVIEQNNKTTHQEYSQFLTFPCTVKQ